VNSLSEEQTWMLTSAASAVVAAVITRAAARTTWKSIRGTRPPRNPASPRTSWPQAVAWALGTGVVVSMARLLAERAAAEGWRESFGHLPFGRWR
jgi:Protein of unknown function (DUF4235)